MQGVVSPGSKLYMSRSGRRCKASSSTGKPCQSFAVDGSEFCFWHAPELAERRKLARSNGGRARHGRTVATDKTPVKLESLGDVVVLVERAVNDLLQLETSVSRARALGYLASVATKALEVSDLEQRIARLEAEVGAR